MGAKAKLCWMLFKEAVDPWSIIPYHYRSEDELENLIERLYYSGELTMNSQRWRVLT